jgi:hypothetical protein
VRPVVTTPIHAFRPEPVMNAAFSQLEVSFGSTRQ